MSSLAPSSLSFPHAEPPEPGTLVEIAPGILWLRLALPFLLDHVNIYLIEEEEGWAVLDTGLGDERTEAAWDAVFAGPLRGQKLTRVIATHFHPDHVGLVGWLTQRFGVELWMPRTEYIFSLMLRGNLQSLKSPEHLRFFRRNGLSEESIEALVGRGHSYLHRVTPMPTSHRRIAAGEHLPIGGRAMEVLTGGGHAPEQAMLLCRDAGLFFSADQVLARISPNVSVWAWEPFENPLGEYLASLAELRSQVPDDVLVLAAHNLPFRGVHARLDALIAHHAERCAMIADACVTEPRSAAEIIPVLFRREMDAHQTGFAFGEVVAHVNYMVARGEVLAHEDGGVVRVRTS
jgi:glyoxylase-like metal-dependent hydrolase (beta-lactamase superfamily II)